MHYLGIPQDSDIMEKLEWTGMFSETKINLQNATPAQILELILKDKWKLLEDDRDMIVMYHKLGYELDGEHKMIESSMVVEGEDRINTAMSKNGWDTCCYCNQAYPPRRYTR